MSPTTLSSQSLKLTHEQVIERFKAYLLKYKQYRSYAKVMMPGIMQNSWRKNFHTFAHKGDNVLVWLSRSENECSVYCIAPGINAPQGWDEFLVCKPHWVKPVLDADLIAKIREAV